MAAATITTSALAKALAAPARQIYEYGKKRLDAELRYLRNEQSLREVAKHLRKIERVKTFWSDNKEVPLSSFYYPSRIIMDGSDPTTIHSLADLPPGHSYVIQGTIGQGKSIFMRYLAGKELMRGQDARIPLLAELRFLQAEESFEAFLFHIFEAAGLKISKELFDIYAESGRIVLFLDAFDELDPALVRRTIRDLERLMGRFPNLQVIVSARPGTSIQRAQGFRVVHLASLIKTDHPQFLRRLIKNEKQVANLLAATEKSSSSIDDLLTTPLLLTLLVILYAAHQHIPDTVSEFYSELFDVLFYKHDRTKSGFVRKRHVDLSDQKIKRIFEGVCFHSVLRNYRSFDNDKLSECVNAAAGHVLVDVDPSKFRDEIVNTACLLKEEGRELSFIHKSVQEFYSASFVAKASDEFARRFYEEVNAIGPRYHVSWGQQLRFLEDIDEWRFAKFYWLPIADKVASTIGVKPAELYNGGRGLSHAEAMKLLEGTTADFSCFWNPDGTGGQPDVVWDDPQGVYEGPLLANNVLDDLFFAMCPMLTMEWIPDTSKKKMEKLGEEIAKVANDRRVEFEGRKFDCVVENMPISFDFVESELALFEMQLCDLLSYSNALEGRLWEVNESIDNLGYVRGRYLEIVEAEARKSDIFERMKLRDAGGD